MVYNVHVHQLTVSFKPIAFLPFSLPSPPLLLKLPNISVECHSPSTGIILKLGLVFGCECKAYNARQEGKEKKKLL